MNFLYIRLDMKFLSQSNSLTNSRLLQDTKRDEGWNQCILQVLSETIQKLNHCIPSTNRFQNKAIVIMPPTTEVPANSHHLYVTADLAETPQNMS